MPVEMTTWSCEAEPIRPTGHWLSRSGRSNDVTVVPLGMESNKGICPNE